MSRAKTTHVPPSAALAFAAVLAAAPAPSVATTLAAAEPPRESAAFEPPLDGALQIVVFETTDCIYCSLFRRHVLPAYSASPRSRSVPLRFVDLNAPDLDALRLDGPVDLLPTAVLMRNNREVGRIPGYVAPESFFHAVNHLMARVE